MTERIEYIKIFENGIDHINCGKVLADQEFFGFAISHLILGIEELIKYQVVMTSSADESLFTEKEKKAVYKYHDSKHTLIKEFQEALSKEFSSVFLDYVFHLATDRELEEKHIAISQNRFKEIGSFLYHSYQEINIPANERDSFFEWLRNANSLKNDGFYVNVSEAGIWIPKNLTSTHYATAFKYAEAIRKQTEIIKSLDITDDEFRDILNSEI
jgi:AbiV family abortive infection protein